MRSVLFLLLSQLVICMWGESFLLVFSLPLLPLLPVVIVVVAVAVV